MKILVTGGTGFIGRAACRHLVERGHDVRVAVRNLARAKTLLPGTELSETEDLAADPDWDRPLAGRDAVLYLAARVHRLRGREGDADYDPVNAVAAVRLASEAAAHGVRRFVYLSSIKVNGERTLGPAFADCSAAPGDAYARSKHRAEVGLKQVAARTGLEVVILRPPLVYGPGVRANFLRLCKLVELAHFVPLPLGSVRNARNMMYVENLAEALRCSLESNRPGSCYVLADPEPFSTPMIFRHLGRGLGVRPRLVPFPSAALRAIAALSGRGEMVGRLVDSLEVDPSVFARDYGWAPRYTGEEGLAATAKWFKARSLAG